MMSDTSLAFGRFKQLADKRHKYLIANKLDENFAVAALTALVFLLRDLAGSLHGIDLSVEFLRDLEGGGEIHLRPPRRPTTGAESQG